MTRKPSRSSGYVRSFCTASSSSTRRMVAASGIGVFTWKRSLPDPRPTIERRGSRPACAAVIAPAATAARSTGPSTGASTAAPGYSSDCRSSCSPSASRRPSALQPPNLPPAFDRTDAADARGRPRATATRAAFPGPAAGTPQPDGSRASSARTGTRSGGRRSRPPCPAAAGSGSSTSSSRSAASRTRRSSSSPTETTPAPARARTTTRRAPPRSSSSRARTRRRAAPRSSGCRTRSSSSRPTAARLRRPRRGRVRSPLARAAGRHRRHRPGRDRRQRDSRGSSWPATPRARPASGLVQTVRAQLAAETGADPGRPSALRQLVDLGFPFSPYEQAPFVARGVPAVTITTSPDRPPSGVGDSPGSLDGARLGQIGRATQNVVDALEQGIALSPGPSSYVFLGSRIVRGWAVEIVLVATLLPFLVAAIDLFARCRRRRIRISPALRSYRSRLGFWAWCGVLFALFAAAGAWPGGVSRPPLLTNVHWPAAALAGPRHPRRRRLARHARPARSAPAAERRRRRSPGHAGALLALGVVALLVVATNPVRVDLHPALAPLLALAPAGARPRTRAARRGAPPRLRRAGAPRLVVRHALRARSRGAVVRRVAVLAPLRDGVPGLLIGLAWAAAAAQLVALSAGRYAPYPTRGRATSARPDPRDDPPARARAPAARIRSGPTGVARLSGTSRLSHPHRGRRAPARVGDRRLALAGPVHRAVHALAAGEARARAQQEFAAFTPLRAAASAGRARRDRRRGRALPARARTRAKRSAASSSGVSG